MGHFGISGRVMGSWLNGGMECITLFLQLNLARVFVLSDGKGVR